MEERKERNENLEVNEGMTEEQQQEVLVTDDFEEETSSKKGIFIGIAIAAIVILLVVIAIIVIAKKGKSEVQQPANVKEEVTVEETVEVQKPVKEETAVVEESTEEETVEEVQVEDPTANLSNEEWVQSLNLQKGTFLIFNDTTGERKVLEDGQEYTLLEGDQLAFWWPLDWMLLMENYSLFHSSELKYACSVYDLNLDAISEKTEFSVICSNENNENVTITIYLSK